MIDAQNKLSHHIMILVLSSLFVFLVHLSGISLGRAVGAIPFVILFLVLIIGPVMEIWPGLSKKLPRGFPWTWRAELGIWFTIWSIIHILLVFSGRDWDIIGYFIGISPWALGAFVAVGMAIILSIFSFRWAISYFGAESWKWLQNYFTYVIFWLAFVHVIDRALLRPGFPSSDWLHWMYLLMLFLIPILQLVGFIKVFNRKKSKSSKK